MYKNYGWNNDNTINPPSLEFVQEIRTSNLEKLSGSYLKGVMVEFLSNHLSEKVYLIWLLGSPSPAQNTITTVCHGNTPFNKASAKMLLYTTPIPPERSITY